MKINADSPFDPPDSLTPDVAIDLTVRNGHQKTWVLLHDYTAVVPKSTGGENYEN